MSVQWCLSGFPRKLRDRIKREAFLAEELIIKREAERAMGHFEGQHLDRSISLRQNNSAFRRRPANNQGTAL